MSRTIKRVSRSGDRKHSGDQKHTFFWGPNQEQLISLYVDIANIVMSYLLYIYFNLICSTGKICMKLSQLWIFCPKIFGKV